VADDLIELLRLFELVEGTSGPLELRVVATLGLAQSTGTFIVEVLGRGRVDVTLGTGRVVGAADDRRL
jgi:hypothetical protein